MPREFAGVITGIFGYDQRPAYKAARRDPVFNKRGPGGYQG